MALRIDLADGPLPHLAVRDPGAARPVRALFTTRKGGISAGDFASLNLGDRVGDDPPLVRANLRRLRETFAVPEEALFTVRQVHGTNVVRVARGMAPAESAELEADILVTDLPGTNLLMRFADCLPLVVWGPGGRALGLAHCGWRGVADGIVDRLLSAFAIEFALDPPELSAALGPCIGQECFAVGDEVVSTFLQRFCDLPGVARLVGRGVAGGRIDLPGVVRAQLLRRGVPAGRVAASGLCTSCRADLFFSHRRDRGRTGRIACLAGIPPEAS